MGGRGASSYGRISQGESDALEYYVSGDGMYINQYLRKGETLSNNEKEFVSDMDKVTQRDTIVGTLYRTVDASAIFGNISDSMFENLQSELMYNSFSKDKGSYSQSILKNINSLISNAEGKTILEKGFMSTTKSLDIAENLQYNFGSSKPVILEIKTTGKTKGVDVNKHANSRMREAENSDPQKEVLLSRNQKYQINKIGVKNGNIYITASLK